ncbi:MAG: metallophosphoesterase [Saprospiraceae bacterium]|nr:metallophosphoesterase [Candidatus Vicinibacter affinis]
MPGNHDVIWSQAKSYFIEKLISGTKLSDVLLSIDKRYFRSCFREYIGFHKANASVPIDSKCFSHTYTDDEELNFICLNSAWLSVGNPVHEANIKMRQIQKTISHDIFTEDGKSMIFSELGNQSYGFKIKGIVSESLDSIRTTLSHKTLRDKFNIILVHHPPNNWLRWDELYDEGATVKGPLHTFIKSCSVDMVCCGHEHTSQVEGGVIFGQTLVLNGGMFLDHRQENYTNMWFKLLEINTDEKSVEETPFLYHQADEKWNSQSGLKYCGWSSVYTRKSDQNNSKAPANSNETWDPHTQKRKDLEFHPQSIQDLLEFLLEPMQGLHVIIEQLSRKMGMKSNLKPDVVELNKTRQLNIIEWEDKILILLSVNEILNLAIDKKHINFFSDICTVVKERF